MKIRGSEGRLKAIEEFKIQENIITTTRYRLCHGIRYFCLLSYFFHFRNFFVFVHRLFPDVSRSFVIFVCSWVCEVSFYMATYIVGLKTPRTHNGNAVVNTRRWLMHSFATFVSTVRPPTAHQCRRFRGTKPPTPDYRRALNRFLILKKKNG